MALFHKGGGGGASSLGSVVGCRVEGQAIDTALGQCFIPIHLISPGCPRPNSALTVHKSGLKHCSCFIRISPLIKILCSAYQCALYVDGWRVILMKQCCKWNADKLAVYTHECFHWLSTLTSELHLFQDIQNALYMFLYDILIGFCCLKITKCF